jgi:hypothetical protein
MPISRSRSPKSYRNELTGALEIFGKIKAKHRRWMRFSSSLADREAVSHPHPVYTVRLGTFLAGERLSATLKRVAWMYFLQDRGKGLACAEVSIVSGRHKNARLSEGPFVKKLFQVIEKLNSDPRAGRRRYELRTIRLESMHSFCVWLKLSSQVEYFIPVVSRSALLRAGKWLSRAEFTEALRSEAGRVRAAHERMSNLLKARQSVD